MTRPRGSGTLALGLGLLAAMWLLRPGGLALYDGLQQPTEPYRFLHPPATSNQHGAPTAVDVMVPVTGGTSPQIGLQTSETTPQAALSIPAGGLALPPGTAALRVVVMAVDPPPPPHAGGTLDGDVYRMQVTANGVAVPLAPGQVAYMTLEGTGASGAPHIEVFADGGWRTVETSPSGTANLWFGPTAVLGDAALVLAPHSATTQPTELSTAAISAIVLGSTLAVVAAVLLGVRRSRRRGA